MAGLQPLIDKLKKVPAFSLSEINKSIDLFAPDMEAANRSQLENEGKDIFDRSLGKYAPSTKLRKRSKGQRSDHVTLKDSGEFHESIELKKVSPVERVFVSNDPKFAQSPVNLKKKYGDVLGLNPRAFALFEASVFNSFSVKLKRFLNA